MTTVDTQENKANLYAQTVDGASIAAMLQHKVDIISLSVVINSLLQKKQAGGFIIDIKTSNSTLLDCLCKEYAEIVTGQWD